MTRTMQVTGVTGCCLLHHEVLSHHSLITASRNTEALMFAPIFIVSIFTARRFASAVLATAIPSVCPSVRLSRAGIV